jgi:hypothetical protein
MLDYLHYFVELRTWMQAKNNFVAYIFPVLEVKSGDSILLFES